MADARPGKVALVLAGGAALGAYEVGVVSYLVDDVAAALGRDVPLDILSGTSAGAINTSFLASHADEPRGRGARLAALWTQLRLGDVLRPSGREVLGLVLDGHAPECLRARRGGILDPRPLQALFHRSAPMERIDEHLRAGRLHAVTVSATHVPTGRCTSFVQSLDPITGPPDPLAPTIAAQLTPAHALASAAIPLLFPPVTIAGEPYCDGGLRQVVPLAPALRFGADAVVVVNPVAAPDPGAPAPGRDALTSPVYLAGKALNALVLDRMEVDLTRLDQINAILGAGARRFGDGFARELNAQLATDGHAPLSEVRTLRFQPSRDLGHLAAEYVAGPAFARHEHSLVGLVLRLLGPSDPTHAGDLLSYLLFDGGFAAELIALGRADARARHDEICAFFAAQDAR